MAKPEGKKPDPRKIITGVARLSYAYVWSPRPPDADKPDGKAMYQVSVIIPKSDKDTIARINAACDYVKANDKDKWGGATKGLKMPLRDGDEDREDEAYKGCYFLNASSQQAPEIVERAADGAIEPIMDKTKVYSGCYARVSLRFYAFNTKGNKGIAVGLGNILKVRDGEPLSGRESAEDEFGDLPADDADEPMFQ